MTEAKATQTHDQLYCRRSEKNRVGVPDHTLYSKKQLQNGAQQPPAAPGGPSRPQASTGEGPLETEG